MSNNNQQGNTELIIGMMILAAIAIAVMVFGSVMAVVGVSIYLLNEWRKIYRYEGSTSILWLAGVTAVFSIFSVTKAFEHARLFSFYLQQGKSVGDLVILHGFLTLLAIVSIGIPTLLYGFYRKIRPISHIKTGTIDLLYAQYRSGDITRLERNSRLRTTIATSGDELERRFAESKRQQHQAIGRSNVAFDVPEQD